MISIDTLDGKMQNSRTGWHRVSCGINCDCRVFGFSAGMEGLDRGTWFFRLKSCVAVFVAMQWVTLVYTIDG